MSRSDGKPGEFSEWLEEGGNTSLYFQRPLQLENSRYLLINVMGKNNTYAGSPEYTQSLPFSAVQHFYLPRKKAPTHLLRVWDPDWEAERGDWALGAVWDMEGALAEVATGGALLEEGVHM